MVVGVVSIAVLAAYCWVVYEFRTQAAGCLKNAVGLVPEDSAGSDNKLIYSRFLNAALVLGVVVLGIAVEKIVGVWGGGGVVMAVVAVLAICVMAVQFGILWAAGRLTLAYELTDGIWRAKKRYFAVAAMLITPFVVMISGMGSAGGGEWVGDLEFGLDLAKWSVRNLSILYIVVAEVVTIAVMFAVQTLLLFVRQKVSVLVWFLYLCAVEILPVSLLVLIGIKIF